MLLSRDAILNASDIETEDVEVPEWGGTVRLQALSGHERDRFEASLQDQKTGKVDTSNVRAKLIALCAVNEDGTKTFKPIEAAALGKRSARALDRLVAVAKRLSGIDDKDIEEIEKNSESDQSDDSGSSSPGNIESFPTSSSTD